MLKTLLNTLLIVLLSAQLTQAESFIFGDNTNGFTGSSDATLVNGDFELSLSAGPSGAVLNELDDEGMGINTSGITDVIDGGSTGDTRKFNVIDGTAAVSGQGESLTFSFDRAGILQDLLFDGMKDETLEYFTIEFPDATIRTFFDFEVELRVNDQGFLLSDLGVPNPTLAVDSSDDYLGINYAFSAGEVFTITYGEIDYQSALPGYDPVGSDKVGNGARFEGIVVTIPEPSALGLTAICLGLALTRRK